MKWIYCQIIGDDIEEKACLKEQKKRIGAEGKALDLEGVITCKGCLASTRKCVKCHKKGTVVYGDSGLCITCHRIVKKDIFGVDEWKKKIIKSIKENIYCQASDHKIKPIVCFEMQGRHFCSGCQAPTRLCLNCQRRISEHADSGLCDICYRKIKPQKKVSVISDPKIEEIISRAAYLYNLRVEDILKKNINREIRISRDIVIYILHTKLEMKFVKILKILKLKNYPTARNGYKRIKRRIPQKTLEKICQFVLGEKGQEINRFETKQMLLKKYTREDIK